MRVDAPSFSQNYTITLTGRPQDGKEWSVSSADKYRVIVKKTDASGKVRDESSNWGVYPSYVYYCSTNVPIIVSFTGESHFATTRKSDLDVWHACIWITRGFARRRYRVVRRGSGASSVCIGRRGRRRGRE